MRILALDIGERRIGIALSDELGIAAHPLETIQRGTLSKDLKRLKQLAQEHTAEQIVVGLPRNMNGTLGEQAKIVLEFSERLKKVISSIPVIMWDERLTSRAAERVLLEADLSRKKRKQKIDQLAAVLILQGYLNGMGHDTADT